MSAIKRVLLVLLAAVMLSALPAYCQSAVVTPFPDVTLNGSTAQQVSVAVSSTASCRWVLFVGLATNAAVVRVGDSTVNATTGIPVSATGGVIPPPSVEIGNHWYSLSTLYVYGSTGDKVSITCGS